MTKPVDDLEAIRLVIEALDPFDAKERERIIRWASEKLGMAAPSALAPSTAVPPHQPGTSSVAVGAAKDIKSFVMQKSPRSDNQMAAVVAYYYHFEAPATERKESIGKEELIDACRKSDRKRPARPDQVLVNTYHAGLFDKAGSAGQYRLNSVGENLVAMVLPEQGAATNSSTRKPKAASGKHIRGSKAKKRKVASKSK
jgi:hypothetical protein